MRAALMVLGLLYSFVRFLPDLVVLCRTTEATLQTDPAEHGQALEDLRGQQLLIELRFALVDRG